jgi:uncharacterized membrane protein
MFTIIGGDGKEYGPVSAEQVRAWIASGRANLQTKAKYAGTEEWHTLGDYTEFAGGGAPPPVVTAPVSANASDPKAYAAELIARATPLDVFGCLDRSFKLWTGNFFPLVGVTLLVIVAAAIAGAIPLVGILSNLLLTGVFYGGLYYYYLGKVRGEPRTVGDAFGGFSMAFVPLMLANLITVAINLVLMIVCCAPVFSYFIKAAMQANRHVEPTLPHFSGLALVGFAIGFVIMVYLAVSWVFTFPLIIDQRLGPWTAMEVSRRVVSKQWFRVFFVLFLGGIIALLGVIAVFIGVFFTLPLLFGAVVYAYEALCRPPPRA